MDNITEKDIVLIGNGPSAIGYEYGELIDSFHNIGRFNNFHIEKFEKFVGTKTTHWFTTGNFPGVKDKNYFKDIYYVITPTWEVLNCFNKFRNVFCDDIFKKILLFPEIPFWEIRRKYGYWNPSSGLVVSLLFSMIYERVFISGFDFFLSDTHHYGDAAVDCFHKGKIEKVIFDRMKKERKNIFNLEELL